MVDLMQVHPPQGELIKAQNLHRDTDKPRTLFAYIPPALFRTAIKRTNAEFTTESLSAFFLPLPRPFSHLLSFSLLDDRNEGNRIKLSIRSEMRWQRRKARKTFDFSSHACIDWKKASSLSLSTEVSRIYLCKSVKSLPRQ